MADLRRANHLWSSDSIHMRTQLYIPVEKATRTQSLQRDGILISISPAEEIPDPLEEPEQPELQTPVSDDSPYSGTGTIRRIPVSHLSFFPPASTSILKGTPARPLPFVGQHTPPTSHRPHLNHSRHASSPSHSLTSLLTALPIAASTRDTIIARLSFDSVSSSYSDQEQVNDNHEGLELDDVQHTGSRNLPAHDMTDEMTFGHNLPTPKASHRVPHSDRSSIKSQPPSPTHMRTLSSSPQAYIPPHAQVRTMQLEPSPEMQVPASKAPRRQSQSPKRNHQTARMAGFEVDRPVR